MGPYDGEAVERCLACEAVVNRAHRHILPFRVLRSVVCQMCHLGPSKPTSTSLSAQPSSVGAEYL
jgi:hypothetical protein